MAQTPNYDPAALSPAAAPAVHTHTHVHPARLQLGLAAYPGALTANPPDVLRVRNYLAAAVTITELHYEVRSPPAGAAINIELRRNGVTVHSGTIAAGASRANYTALALTWPVDDGLEVVVTQVGSTTPGSFLTAVAVATTTGSGA